MGEAGGGGGEEGHDVRVHLRDDEVVYVEHLGEAGHGEVVVDAAVDPAERGWVPGGVLAGGGVLGEDVGRGEDEGDGAGGGDGGPDEDVGAGDVVEEARELVDGGGRDADVEDAACAVVSFLESHVAEELLHHLGEVLDVYPGSLGEETRDMFQGALFTILLFEHGEITMGKSSQHFGDLFVRACAQHRADYGACRRPRDDAREQLLLKQSFENANMVHPERRPAAEQQRTPPKRLPRKHNLLHYILRL